jgi:hypothetical protein
MFVVPVVVDLRPRGYEIEQDLTAAPAEEKIPARTMTKTFFNSPAEKVG